MEQRLTKPIHHGTNAKVDRMKRIVKVATWKRYPYDDQDFLRMSLTGFHDAIQFRTPSQDTQQFHALRILKKSKQLSRINSS